jgi:hypothetical protein
MTTSEFLEAFAQVAARYKWEGKTDLRGEQDGQQFCPITAVCWAKQAKFYRIENYPGAATELGLDMLEAADIAWAADYPWLVGDDAPRRKEIRRSLRRICQLRPERD